MPVTSTESQETGTTLSVKLRRPPLIKGSDAKTVLAFEDGLDPALGDSPLALPGLRGVEPVLPVPAQALQEAEMQAKSLGDEHAEATAAVLCKLFQKPSFGTPMAAGEEALGETTSGRRIGQGRINIFSVGDVATALSHPGRTIMNLRHGYYPPREYEHPCLSSIYDSTLVTLQARSFLAVSSK